MFNKLLFIAVIKMLLVVDLVAADEKLDAQIAAMQRSQSTQSRSDDQQFMYEVNKLPKFKQDLLDLEYQKYLQMSYQYELMQLDLERRQLEMNVAKRRVEASDFEYNAERGRIELELQRMDIEAKRIEFDRRKIRGGRENELVDIELESARSAIKNKDKISESTANAIESVGTALENASQDQDLFD
jgi:hypothetical protein